jgi:hypothetical protein
VAFISELPFAGTASVIIGSTLRAVARLNRKHGRHAVDLERLLDLTFSAPCNFVGRYLNRNGAACPSYSAPAIVDLKNLSTPAIRFRGLAYQSDFLGMSDGGYRDKRSGESEAKRGWHDLNSQQGSIGEGRERN